MCAGAGRMKQLGYLIDELAVGMASEQVHIVTESDVAAFAAATGDTNPLHLDAEFAAKGPFRERIAHGLLAAGYVSALLGTSLPGPGSLYVSQSLNFKRPVRLGDEVAAKVEVIAIDERTSHVTLSCSCRVRGKIVLDGVAVVIPPRAKDA
jgi:3-hydroxybutyryl-CoA dehydratase